MKAESSIAFQLFTANQNELSTMSELEDMQMHQNYVRGF